MIASSLNSFFAVVKECASALVLASSESLRELQDFLEQCFAKKLGFGKHPGFFESVALKNNESLQDTLAKFSCMTSKIECLKIITIQIQTQVNQVSAVVNKKNQSSFDEELSFYYISSLLEQVTNLFVVLTDVVSNYWDYIPYEMQDLVLLIYIGYKTFYKIAYSDCPKEIFKEYVGILTEFSNAFSLLEFSLNQVIGQDFLSKRLYDLKENDVLSTSENSVSMPLVQTKSYTLERLLDEITLENSHEEIDWGELVGGEIC